MTTCSKVLMPIQSFGIGDCIFIQTAIHGIKGEHDKVLWAVQPQFVDGLNYAYPDFTFININSLNTTLQQPFKAKYKSDYGFEMLPFQYSVEICNVPYRDCMKSKYMLYDMDWQLWKDKAIWQRDMTKELNLMRHLKISEFSYNLINLNFRSDMSGKVIIPPIDNGLPNIYMEQIDGYSLFDWGLVMQFANTIHTVSTSIIYMLELLPFRGKEIHLYSRRPEETNFENVDYILTKDKYILHD